MLSYFNPEKFALVVASEDVKALSKASGVGAKTAARIVLELKDKLARELPQSISSTKLAESAVPTQNKSLLTEAQDALTVLGYSRTEAVSALRAVYADGIGLEDLIKKALKELMK